MASSFRFRQDVTQLFDPPDSPYTLKITVGDDPEPAQRQYGGDIPFSRDRNGEFTEFEPIRVTRMDGQGEAAVGWVAHSTYLGSIPKGARIRGIRARVGNMQIGGERVFDHLFQDDRFNRWCVGEVHVIDDRIVPNARRDYFQPGPALRHLENHLGSVFLQIAKRCRAASSVRNRQDKILTELSQVEQACDLLLSGYLSKSGFNDLLGELSAQVRIVRANIGSSGITGEPLARADRVAARLGNGVPTPTSGLFAHFDPSQLKIYQDLCRAVIDASPSPAIAKRVIETILDKVDK